MRDHENGKHTKITVCDLSKVFACVFHDLLLRKLFHFDVRVPPLELKKSTTTMHCRSVKYVLIL